MIDNLLLIYSFSELVNLRVETYQRENEQNYERVCLLLETYRNIFKID